MVGQPNLIDQPGTREYAWDSWPGLRQLPTVDPAAKRIVIDPPEGLIEL